MSRGIGGWLLVCCLVLTSYGALGASLSVFLKNFYTEYEVVKQCQEEAQLTTADAESAKGAMAKIEAHYLQRDASINKDRLLKEAAVNKKEGFRIATRSAKVNLREYCRASLNELLAKAQEVDTSAKSH